VESGNDALAKEKSDQLIYDYRLAALSEDDHVLCDYALKLTLDPGSVTVADVETLKHHGFNEAAINIAAQVISYFNYINRIADGLGVDPEPGMTPTHESWLDRKMSYPRP